MGSVDLAAGFTGLSSLFQGPKWEVALVLKVAGPGEQLRIFSTDEFGLPQSELWRYPDVKR